MSAMVRARWTAQYKDQPVLQMAYSLETVFDDATFIGPRYLSGSVLLYFLKRVYWLQRFYSLWGWHCLFHNAALNLK